MLERFWFRGLRKPYWVLSQNNDISYENPCLGLGERYDHGNAGQNQESLPVLDSPFPFLKSWFAVFFPDALVYIAAERVELRILLPLAGHADDAKWKSGSTVGIAR